MRTCCNDWTTKALMRRRMRVYSLLVRGVDWGESVRRAKPVGWGLCGCNSCSRGEAAGRAETREDISLEMATGEEGDGRSS